MSSSEILVDSAIISPSSSMEASLIFALTKLRTFNWLACLRIVMSYRVT